MDSDEDLLTVGKTQRIEPESGSTPRKDTASESWVEKRSLRAGSNLRGQLSGKVASPYGCVLSTPNVGADSSEGAYRYKAAFALFPERVVEKAGGEVQRYEFGASRPLNPSGQQTTKAEVLRQARCRIPDTKEAERLIRRRLVQVPRPIGPWTGQITVVNTPSNPVLQPKASGECAVDEERKAVYVCSQICIGGDCTELKCKYVMRCVQEENDGDGGSGGSEESEQTGDDPDECNHEGGSADELCNGSGTVDPSNSCDSDNPPDWCDIGCNLSASDLVDGAYLYDQASESARKTLISTLEKHGSNYGVNDKTDVRHFIAQTAHESQGAVTKVENLNYQDAENLAATFSEFSIDGKAGKYKASDYTGRPKEIAKIAYAGRLGNGEKGSGDAYKYRGRGPMQITGRDNYQAFEDWYQNEGFGSVDFTEKPGKLSSNAKIGTLAALQYWDENVLGSDEVDKDNLTVADVTKAINGGDTGLEIRKDHFEKAKDIDCSN